MHDGTKKKRMSDGGAYPSPTISTISYSTPTLVSKEERRKTQNKEASRRSRARRQAQLDSIPHLHKTIEELRSLLCDLVCKFESCVKERDELKKKLFLSESCELFLQALVDQARDDLDKSLL